MPGIVRHETKAILSKAVEHGATVYLSGITAEDKSQPVALQAAEVLATIDRLLAQCGSDRSKLLTAMIWLRDIRDRAALNQVWTAWLGADAAPARACVEANMGADCLVEIQVVAAK